jgi:hypothetical protein
MVADLDDAAFVQAYYVALIAVLADFQLAT